MAHAAWEDALAAARVFAADPHRVGGIRLRSRAGPARDIWLEQLQVSLPGGVLLRRMPAGISPDRLLGGLDLAATLTSGQRRIMPGLLPEADGGIVVVPMAERMQPHVAAALLAALDEGEIAVERDGVAARLAARIGVVLLDEGEGAEEAPPAAIVERCGLWCDLSDVTLAETDGTPVPVEGDQVSDPATVLCRIADQLGVGSARAILAAQKSSRTFALLDGRDRPHEGDVARAVRLCLAPKATRMPQPPVTEQDLSPAEDRDEGSGDPDSANALADRIVEAAQAALPADLLAGLGQGRVARQSGHGSGAIRKSLAHGRPTGTKPGRPGAGARLHIVETLRAAAPWQKLRRGSEDRAVSIRPGDFRIRRFAERSEAMLIFAVDASGSAAAERLAETKGAVELLLAEAYVKRTHVALVSFRGEGAELVVPPTRSLVRAKKCLADMAGGGGTPLAAGIQAAHALAVAAGGKGWTPYVVLLTDGRANVPLIDGSGKSRAEDDARAAARHLGGSGIKSVVIDVAARPRADARDLSHAMGAHYAALPRAGAESVRDVAAAIAL